MESGLQANLDCDGVLFITLDRPERRNAFDEEMAEQLLRLFSQEARDPAVRGVVLNAVGPDFCAGFDLKSRPKLLAETGIAMVAAMYQALFDVPVPTVALVDGVAYGGAIGFLATCDIVVATRIARFACPEARHGLVPGVMAAFLTQAIGPRHALAMIATAAPVSAQRACSWGLVSEVVDDDAALLERADEVLRQILSTGPAAARQVKSLIRLVSGLPLAASIVDEAVSRAAASRQSDEAREGLKAFRERRPPSWSKPPGRPAP